MTDVIPSLLLFKLVPFIVSLSLETFQVSGSPVGAEALENSDSEARWPESTCPTTGRCWDLEQIAQ